MIILHLSNRMEILTARLLREITADPLPPWESLPVLPQNPTLGRWLAFRLAERLGVAMNLDMPLPGVWVRAFLERAGTASGGLPEPLHFDRGSLEVRLLSILPEIRQLPGFEQVSDYLEGGSPSRRIADFSGRVAEILDRAMLYRPEVLVDWEENPSKGGVLGALWRRLAGPGRPCHLARLLVGFQGDGRVSPGLARLLPPRLFLFGLSGLAPNTLEVFRRIGRETECQVHFFFMNPSEKYWADTISLRTFRKLEPRLKPYYAPGHPLLASLGKSARDLHRLLERWVEEDGDRITAEDAFEDPGAGTLLSRIQGEMLRLDPAIAGSPPPPEDRSLMVVACPTPVRELESLRDFLLARLSEDPSLTLEDIAVLAPDLERYDQAIRYVFGGQEGDGTPGAPLLPYTLSDRDGGRDPLLRTLEWMVLLPSRPVTLSDLLDLLALEPFRKKLSLDGRSAGILGEALKRGGFRWGLDGRDRTGEGMDPERHTLQWTLERFLDGYCTGPVSDPFPLPLFPDPQGELTGLLVTLQSRLLSLRSRLEQDRSLSGWADLLEEILSGFFSLDPRSDREVLAFPGELREACRKAGSDPEISFALFFELLRTRWKGRSSRDRFFSGGLTFGRMVPLRAIPFRIICLLGMGDGVFPRNDSVLEFDFIRQEPRALDRSTREDDLHLFLEVLLSARDALWISYPGGLREPNPPSALVLSLLEAAGLPKDPGPPGGLHCRVPIRPFDRVLFDRSAAILQSHSDRWLPFLEKTEPDTPVPFLPESGRLLPPGVRKRSRSRRPEGPERMIPFGDLTAFFRNPSRYEAMRVLGLPEPPRAVCVSDYEPFLLTSRSAFVRERGEPDPAGMPWPPLGELQAAELREKVRDRLCRIAEIIPEAADGGPTICAFSVPVARSVLFGTIPLYEKSGLVLGDSAPFPVRPADLLESYLTHLVAVLGVPGYAGTVVLDWNASCPSHKKIREPLRFHAGSPREARSLLKRYLGLFLRGRTVAVPFVPELSFDYAYEGYWMKKDPQSRLHACREDWKKKINPYRSTGPSVREDRPDPRRKSGYFAHCFFDPAGDWIAGGEFAALAMRLYRPLLSCLPAPPPSEKKTGPAGSRSSVPDETL